MSREAFGPFKISGTIMSSSAEFIGSSVRASPWLSSEEARETLDRDEASVDD